MITITVDYGGVSQTYTNVLGYNHDTPGLFSFRPSDGTNIFLTLTSVTKITVVQATPAPTATK